MNEMTFLAAVHARFNRTWLLRPLLPGAFLVLWMQPGQGAPGGGAAREPLFQTSDRCFACHNGLSSPSGQDVSIGFDWRATMMANSSRYPYWQAAVRREIIDHPEAQAEIEDECAACHMPMSRFESRRAGHEGQVFAHLPFDPDQTADRLAADGVSCSLCHQISEEKLGEPDSFGGGFTIDKTRPRGERRVYGRFEIEDGQTRIMRTSSGGFTPTQSEHIRRSELDRPFEDLDRPRQLARFPEEVRQVVRPSERVGRQQLCVAEAAFRVVQELGSHEQRPHLAVRVATLAWRDLAVARGRHQRPVRLAELLLDGRVQATDVGQRHPLEDSRLAVPLQRRACRGPRLVHSRTGEEAEQDGDRQDVAS